MELVAFIAGEPHSDRPKCACPVLRDYGVRLNDRMSDDVRNDLLHPLVPMMLNTRSSDHEQARAEYIVRQTFIRILPLVIENSAELVRFAKTGTLKEMAAATAAAFIDRASYTVYTAYTAVYNAASARAAVARAAVARAAVARAAIARAAIANAAAANAAANSAFAAASASASDVWPIAAQILKEAIEMGPHDPTAYNHERVLEACKYNKGA